MEVKCIIIIKEVAAAKKKLFPAKAPASAKSPAKSKPTSRQQQWSRGMSPLQSRQHLYEIAMQGYDKQCGGEVFDSCRIGSCKVTAAIACTAAMTLLSLRMHFDWAI